MYNVGDDNELDRLSREAAGRYTPPGKADWDSLSTELDKVLPVKEEKKRRGLLLWWLLPVLLIGGAVTYWQVSKDVPDTQALKIAEQKQPAQDKKQDLAPVQPNDAVTASTNVQKEKTTTVTDKQEAVINKENGISRKPGKIASPEKESASSGENVLALNGKRKLNAGSHTDEGKSNKEITFKADQPVTDKTVALIINPTVDKEPAKENTQKSNVDQPVQETVQPTKETKVEPAPVAENIPDATTPQPSKDKLNSARGKGWSYGFLAGIDKSTVKFKYQDGAGINIGAMLGYHFNDKISVHTGAIYTQKNYKVAGEDFTAPKGSWVSYYNLETVKGYCRMWEVPLLLRYTVSQSDKRSFFLSTGLSSYFMTRENYDYTYYSAGAGLVTRNSAYDSKDTHVLSIAHFSAGFERRLGKAWSLMVEPYAKIPLGGVGFGNIQLSSFGLNFSVQHRQPSKK
jgi:hypothetical protein